MLVLAFDTATAAITAAIYDDAAADGVVASASTQGATAHGELLTPVIAEVLAEAGVTPAQLTDIAVGVGPGPFTGLRVGVVTALTLSSTLGIPAHGVCSLDVIAAEVVAANPVPVGPGGAGFLIASDARRGEVYWARYGDDGTRLEGPDVDVAVALADRFAGFPVFGRGAQLYSDAWPGANAIGPWEPSAAFLARLVATGGALELPVEPLYLRRPDAQPIAER